MMAFKAADPATETDADSAPDPANGGRVIAATLLAMLRTRVELLCADLAEERESLVAQVRLAAIAALAGLLAAFTVILAVAAAAPEDFRPVVLAGLAVALGGLSFWATRLRARHKPRFGKPLERAVEQLRRDAAALLDRPEERSHEAP